MAMKLEKVVPRLQQYYNESRAHSSLDRRTPKEMGSEGMRDKKVVSLENYRWESHCRGLYQFPKAA